MYFQYLFDALCYSTVFTLVGLLALIIFFNLCILVLLILLWQYAVYK